MGIKCTIPNHAAGQWHARSDPLDSTGPDPDLMLVGWGSEPDPDSPLGPGNGVCLNEFLDAVLPEDPGAHRLRDGRGADRELAELLRLQTSGLA